MLPSVQISLFSPIPGIRVLFRPCIGKSLFHGLPFGGQPFPVAADFIIPVGKHNTAKLAVRTGVEPFARTADRQSEPEFYAAIRPLAVPEFQIPDAARQRREKKRQRIGIIPYMGAGSLTASHIVKAAFPAIEGTVLQAEAGGRTQNRQVGCNRIQSRFRYGGFIHGVHKRQGFPKQPLSVMQRIGSACPGVLKKNGIVILPGCPVTYIIMNIGGADIQTAPVVVAVRHVPGQHVMEFLHFSRRSLLRDTEHARILVILFPVFITAVFKRLCRGKFPPVGFHMIPPVPAEPVFLTGSLRICGKRKITVGNIPFIDLFRSEMDSADAISFPEAVAGKAALARICYDSRRGIGNGAICGILHQNVCKQRRNAGIPVIERDERIIVTHGNPSRESFIQEGKLRHRVFPLKYQLPEMRHA